MPSDQWTDVDRYLGERLGLTDQVLDGAIQRAHRAGLPEIQVSPPLGRLLHILARSIAARSILEIGTLAGYSAIFLARALPPGGRLITLELDPRHADIARENLAHAGLASLATVIQAPALESLPRLATDPAAPFDLVFIDADKAATPRYFEWALRLSRPGAIIVVDNVVRSGAIADIGDTHPDVVGIREFLDQASRDPRVAITVMQTVGSKGYDGIAVATVLGS